MEEAKPRTQVIFTVSKYQVKMVSGKLFALLCYAS